MKLTDNQEYREVCVMDKYVKTPITAEVTEELHAGDYVYITGTVYVARDAAHKRLVEALNQTEKEF